MPKKKLIETQEQQSERFRQSVRDLVAAGELNPTDADAIMKKMLKTGAKIRLKSKDSS